MDYIKYLTDGIETICKNHKCRVTGSESVRAAEAEIAESMKDCVDEIRTQSFDVHPHAFLASVPLEAVLCIAACGFFIAGVCTGRAWTYLVSLILMIVAVVCLVGEFALYRQVIDRFFPKRTGQNLYMVRKAKNAPKRRIILCGHADAAYEMPLLKHFPTVLLFI